MNIGILSRNNQLYSTRRLVEAAKSRGHDAVVLDHLKFFIGIEGDQPMVRYKGESLENIDAIIPRIGASVTSYGTTVVRQFEAKGTFTINKSQAILSSRDKLRSLQLLSKMKIDVPKTVFANKATKIHEVFEYLGGAPVIIKLLEGTQGVGVILAETEKTAKSIIEAFNGIKTDIIIQEFIKEAGGADIRAFVIGGEVVACMKRQGKEGEFRSNLHQGGRMESIQLTKEEEQLAIRAAAAMELNMAGVDMLRSSRGPLIMEVNSSPGLEGIEKHSKVDVAGKIIDFISNKCNNGTDCKTGFRFS